MNLQPWHPAFIEKNNDLPQWHPALLDERSVWVQKGWITVNGRHILIDDNNKGGASKGSRANVNHSGSGLSYKQSQDLVSHESVDQLRVAQYKRLIQTSRPTT